MCIVGDLEDVLSRSHEELNLLNGNEDEEEDLDHKELCTVNNDCILL